MNDTGRRILLNCDMGESFGAWRMGDDVHSMPLVDQANLACGFHAGDPLTMRRAVELAVRHGVNIGAHPAYPDLRAASAGARWPALPKRCMPWCCMPDRRARRAGRFLPFPRRPGGLRQAAWRAVQRPGRRRRAAARCARRLRAYRKGLPLMVLALADNRELELADEPTCRTVRGLRRSRLPDGRLAPRRRRRGASRSAADHRASPGHRPRRGLPRLRRQPAAPDRRQSLRAWRQPGVAGGPPAPARGPGQPVIRIEPAGAEALLLTLAEEPEVDLSVRLAELARRLREGLGEGVRDLVPGWTTLMLHYDPASPRRYWKNAWVRCWRSGTPGARRGCRAPARDSVWYAGEDLATVAVACGLTGEGVIELRAAEYRVGAIGFAPGFAYLGGLDPRLVLPRRATRGRVYRPAAWPLPRRRRRSIRRPRPAAGTCWDAVRGVRSIRPPLLRAHWRWATGCASSPSGARTSSTWAGANEWFAGRQGGTAEPAAGRRPAWLAAPRRIRGRPSGPPGGSLGQSSAR